MPRRFRMPKPKRPKRVSYEVIAADSVVGLPMYRLLETLVDAHHRELDRARMALAWCTSWKPDVDGRVTLGKCKKASDLDRELAAFDFVILLRQSFWQDLRVTDAQRTALLDHELCHARLKYDDKGEPLEDERGRLVYRTRKHDVEEFSEIVNRHGMWTTDLEGFARAIRTSAARPYEPCAKCRDHGTPGWLPFDDPVGGAKRTRRCECYVQWAQLREAWQIDQVPA